MSESPLYYVPPLEYDVDDDWAPGQVIPVRGDPRLRPTILQPSPSRRAFVMAMFNRLGLDVTRSLTWDWPPRV